MKKDVLIHIAGLHPEQAEGEAVELCVPGSYMENGETKYISYDETQEDGTCAHCRLKITGDELVMTKQGAITTQMFFKTGETYENVYETQFGTFEISIRTKRVGDGVNTFSDERKVLMNKELEYELWMNNEFTSNCNMKIAVFEKI